MTGAAASSSGPRPGATGAESEIVTAMPAEIIGAVPTTKQLKALAPGDRWDLEDRLAEARSIIREINEDELRRWVEVDGKTQTEIAKLVGRSQARISQRCSALGIVSGRTNSGEKRASISTDTPDPIGEVIDAEVVDDDVSEGDDTVPAIPIPIPIIEPVAIDVGAEDHVRRFLATYRPEPFDTGIRQAFEDQLPADIYVDGELPVALGDALELYIVAIECINDFVHQEIGYDEQGKLALKDELALIIPLLSDNLDGAGASWIMRLEETANVAGRLWRQLDSSITRAARP